MYKIKEWIFRKKVSEEKLELIKQVGWELSDIFPLTDLAKSTTKSKTKDEASGVHAWILLHYPKIYRTLIFDNRVIDLACLYARRNFKPEILKLISLKDLKKFTASLMLIEKTDLKNHPEIVFDKVIIFTKKEFYDSISKEHDAKLEWNGWETTGKKLHLNAALMAMVSDDIPMIIATYSPGRSTIYYEADFEDEEKQHEKEKILTKQYHQVKVQLATFQKKLDKTKTLATDYAKMLSDATKEAQRQRYKNFRSKIDEIDRRKEAQSTTGNKKPIITNWTPIIAIIIFLVGAFVLLLIYLKFQTGGASTPSGTVNPSLSIYKIMFNLLGMRL